jgi:mannan endo-1,4-beta-mannosidase
VNSRTTHEEIDVQSTPVGTADPRAAATVVAAYEELVTAPSRKDRRLVVGQALRGWDFAQPVDQPLTALADAGLPLPALVELDLTDFGVTEEHDDELRALLVRHAHAGGLIGFSFHAGNPFTGGGVDDRTDVDLSQLADPSNPSTKAGTAWRSELDRIADVIELFPDAVTMFRPLHESNGDWFWWGQADHDEFRALWRGVFTYLTTRRELHNLLWVYSANRNLGSAVSDPTQRYPGGDVVDVVGLDIYDDDLVDSEPGYQAMLALGKPFGITEYGATNWPTAHDGFVELPNQEVIDKIKKDFKRTAIATAWYSSNGNNWQISDKPRPEALLLDPWAITLAGHV